MLGGNENIVNTNWGDPAILLLFVFDNNLRFAVRSKPCDRTRVTLICHLFTDLVGQHVRVRVQDFLVPFVSGVTKHQTLVSCAEVFFFLISVDGGGDVHILGFNLGDHITVRTVETHLFGVEANTTADFSGDLLKVDGVF